MDLPISTPALLFPPVDRWHPFAEALGVWMYRDRDLAFQLPVVNHQPSDYVPAPKSPGTFDCQVDSPLMAGLPRVASGGRIFTPSGVPLEGDWAPGRLQVVSSEMRESGNGTERPLGARLDAKRTATTVVEEGALVVEESLSFAETPSAVTIMLPESLRPLQVRIEESSSAAHLTTTDVSGIAPHRSFWGELRRLHEIHLAPAREVKVRYRVLPKVRVVVYPGDHDYVRALYEHLPAERFSVQYVNQGANDLDLRARAHPAGCG
ncbi:MAG: hypothetical protein HC904_16420, partial [Blastochloris sp.]|nr:hypothetical protein [Blastochloris sp.]